MVKPGLPEWAVYGDATHRGNLIASIHLAEADLEEHNQHLNDKYARDRGRTSSGPTCSAATTPRSLVVACNTPARMAKGAVETLRERRA